MSTTPLIKFTDDCDTGFLVSDGSDWSVVGGGIDPLNERLKKVERNLERVMKRLSVLDEPTDEQLEKHKMLKDAYTKYKFLEELCGKEE